LEYKTEEFIIIKKRKRKSREEKTEFYLDVYERKFIKHRLSRKTPDEIMQLVSEEK